MGKAAAGFAFTAEKGRSVRPPRSGPRLGGGKPIRL